MSSLLNSPPFPHSNSASLQKAADEGGRSRQAECRERKDCTAEEGPQACGGVREVQAGDAKICNPRHGMGLNAPFTKFETVFATES